MTPADDDPESLVNVPPPEQVAAPPPTPEQISHTGVPLWSTIGARLAMAMFLHHFSLGAWIVTLGTYVMANAGEGGMFDVRMVGSIYGAGPIGGMIAPFIAGFLADHFFATERIMAVLHLVGAASLYAAVQADSQGLFYAWLIVYFACFMPSFALVSSMTLHHLARPERGFPVVRAFSTMGWIAGGIVVGWVWPQLTGQNIEATVVPIQIGAWGELATALFCLTLPHTPPVNRRAPKALPHLSGSETLDLLRSRRFLALMVVAVLASIPSQFYYAYGNVFFNWVGMEAAAAKMTLGQMIEVLCMFLLPSVLLRVSVKASIAIGLAAWCVRFTMLAISAWPTAPARDLLFYAAILLHGVAFVLVSISLQLDVDRCAGRRRRATAQGLLSVAMQGFGCFLGAELAGAAGAHWLPEQLEAATSQGWQMLWLVPASVAAAVMVTAMVLISRDGT